MMFGGSDTNPTCMNIVVNNERRTVKETVTPRRAHLLSTTPQSEARSVRKVHDFGKSASKLMDWMPLLAEAGNCF